MNTPRKNGSYPSPYATPIQQYPSQSEDYLSLQIGGPGSNRKAQTPYKQQHRGRGRFSSTPGKNYQDSEGGGGSGSGGGGVASGRGASVPYFYQNKQQMGGRGQNRFNNGNNRNSNYGGNGNGGGGGGGRQNYQKQNRWSNGGGGRGGGQRNFNKDDISSYFHPTMLEDPWLELMERHNAIRRSEINLQTSSTSERKLREDSSDEEEAGSEGGV